MFELVPAEGACSRGEDHSTRDVREDGVRAASGSCDLMPKSVGRDGRHIWYDPTSICLAADRIPGSRRLGTESLGPIWQGVSR
jgi:hypothetical protein